MNYSNKMSALLIENHVQKNSGILTNPPPYFFSFLFIFFKNLSVIENQQRRASIYVQIIVGREYLTDLFDGLVILLFIVPLFRSFRTVRVPVSWRSVLKQFKTNSNELLAAIVVLKRSFVRNSSIASNFAHLWIIFTTPLLPPSVTPPTFLTRGKTLLLIRFLASPPSPPPKKFKTRTVQTK